MSASKSRPRWADLPGGVRADIEALIGGAVVEAANCPGGYSPGFASRLTLANGRSVFVKAVDSVAWPMEGAHYRSEAAVTAVLPAAVPAPRTLGTRDDGRWVTLAFEYVDGAEPRRLWRADEMDRVVAAVAAFAQGQAAGVAALVQGPAAAPAAFAQGLAAAPAALAQGPATAVAAFAPEPTTAVAAFAPEPTTVAAAFAHGPTAAVAAFARGPTTAVLPRDHPRLGGWAAIARDPVLVAALPATSRWAADRLTSLIRWEADGLAAAQGDAIVHFDLYPHNILLTGDGVAFVDWPHARLGAPVIDPIAVLTSVAADGIDPEPVLRRHVPGAASEPGRWTAVLVAHTGFLVAGALAPPAPGLEAITEAKRHLAAGAMRWLHHRLRLPE